MNDMDPVIDNSGIKDDIIHCAGTIETKSDDVVTLPEGSIQIQENSPEDSEDDDVEVLEGEVLDPEPTIHEYDPIMNALDGMHKARRLNIGDIKPIWRTRETNNGLIYVLTHVEVDGTRYKATDRFKQSLSTGFQVPKTFRYHTPDEVFERVQRFHPRASTRLTTIGDRAYALSSPMRPLITPQLLERVFAAAGKEIKQASYSNGVMKIQTPITGGLPVTLGSEVFGHEILTQIPLDGYGMPELYLTMLRLICTNGMVAYDPAFKTSLQIGGGLDGTSDEGIIDTFSRSLQSFNNEEGFESLTRRIASAAVTPASVAEVQSLRNAIDDSFANHSDAHHALKKVDETMGTLADRYRTANYDHLSTKKVRVMPMYGTVLDMFNIASEITSHQSRKLKSDRLSVFIGTKMRHEFDLEGTEAPKNYQHRDFYL